MTELHTKVSLDLHPDNMKRYEDVLNVEKTHGAAAYHSAREALVHIYQWMAHVEDADLAFQQYGIEGARDHRSVKYLAGGESRVYHGAESEVFEAAGKKMEQVHALYVRRLGEVERAADNLLKDIDRATDNPERKTPEGLGLAAEIRRHVASLPQKSDRLEFMHKAISSDDKETVAAVLRAPAYLSGLDNETAKGLDVAASERWARDEYRQVLAIHKVRENMGRAQDAMIKRHDRLRGTLGVAEKARRKARGKLALLKGGTK